MNYVDTVITAFVEITGKDASVQESLSAAAIDYPLTAVVCTAFEN